MKLTNLKKFNGTQREFINNIGNKSKKGYLKKDKGRNTVHLWWENSDKWFMNVAEEKSNGEIEESIFIIASDLEGFIQYVYVRNNFLCYFDEK